MSLLLLACVLAVHAGRLAMYGDIIILYAFICTLNPLWVSSDGRRSSEEVHLVITCYETRYARHIRIRFNYVRRIWMHEGLPEALILGQSIKSTRFVAALSLSRDQRHGTLSICERG